MDIKELVKFQVMSQIGGGGAQNHSGKNGDQSFRVMMFQLFAMAFISIIDDVMKYVLQMFQDVKQGVSSHFNKKIQENITVMAPKTLADTSVTLNTRHDISYFRMTRVYIVEGNNQNDATQEETNQIVDAVLSHISKLSNVPVFNLIGNGQVMVSFKDKPIQISKDIYCKIDGINFTTTGDVSSIKLTLMSNTVSAADIIKYVRNLYDSYMEEVKNSLGNNIYFFDQKSRESQAPALPASEKAADILMHKRMLISTAPKQLSFTQSPFYSNKTFTNIFGKEIREIEKRVTFFLNNKEWYDKKGVPYQLGLLLSGIPGAGKTSVVRAIANMTKRHIVNVNFANITTATQLKNLFFSDKLQVYTDQSMANHTSYYIPVEQRLYVLEEIDAIGDIVKQRGEEPLDDAAPNLSVNDELTLADILTVLDGTMEVPGRMLVMTTNHPEVLDSALIRPGRIDVKVHFDYADRDLIAEMYKAYMEKDVPEKMKQRLPDKILSPAEVGQVLFRHFNSDSSMEDVIHDFERTAAELEIKRSKKQEIVKETKLMEEKQEVVQETKLMEEKQEVVKQETKVVEEKHNDKNIVIEERNQNVDVKEDQNVVKINGMDQAMIAAANLHEDDLLQKSRENMSLLKKHHEEFFSEQQLQPIYANDNYKPLDDSLEEQYTIGRMVYASAS